jgi:hypothetical protein
MRTDQFRHGTPPRAKTERRIDAQSGVGLPRGSKLAVTQHGQLVHPTKGVRVVKDGLPVPVRGYLGLKLFDEACKKYLTLIAKARATYRRDRASEHWVKRREMNTLVARMTNWQRTQYSREKAFTRESVGRWLTTPRRAA